MNVAAILDIDYEESEIGSPDSEYQVYAPYSLLAQNAVVKERQIGPFLDTSVDPKLSNPYAINSLTAMVDRKD